MTVRIINAHVLDGLAQLEDESVHCVVTSPPYFGLRDYGTEPQVWDGELDCQHEWSLVGRADHPGQVPDGKAVDKENAVGQNVGSGQFCCHCNAWRGSLGLEPTPALYVAHLVEVFREARRVLRGDGTLWVVIGDSYANDGKWGGHTGGKHVTALHASPIGRNKRYSGLKPKDLIGIPWRLAFALQDDGWWLRKDIIWHKPNPMPESCEDRCTTSHEYLFHLSKSERYWYDGHAIKEPFETDPKENYPARATILGRGEQLFADARGNDRDKSGGFPASGGRNKRSVWTIATVPSSFAHFATYPPALIEPCILAGCPVGGTVLDPFIGVGTTAIVAERFARNCIGIELHPVHAATAERRASEPGFPLEAEAADTALAAE